MLQASQAEAGAGKAASESNASRAVAAEAALAELKRTAAADAQALATLNSEVCKSRSLLSSLNFLSLIAPAVTAPCHQSLWG